MLRSFSIESPRIVGVFIPASVLAQVGLWWMSSKQGAVLISCLPLTFGYMLRSFSIASPRTVGVFIPASALAQLDLWWMIFH